MYSTLAQDGNECIYITNHVVTVRVRVLSAHATQGYPDYNRHICEDTKIGLANWNV